MEQKVVLFDETNKKVFHLVFQGIAKLVLPQIVARLIEASLILMFQLNFQLTK